MVRSETYLFSNKDEILDDVLSSKVTLVVGAIDTGKTTLIMELTNEICRRGRTCAIIDADIGQSDIGPPTTIGLGRVVSPIRSLHELEPLALFFVGSISPKGRIAELLFGTMRMVMNGMALNCDHLLVDTTGLIHGPLGRRLKLQKVRLVDPDLVICLQKKEECRFISQAFAFSSRPRVVFLIPPEGIRAKNSNIRRENRKEGLRKHFIGATTKPLSLNESNRLGWPLFWGSPLPEKEKERLGRVLRDHILWAEASSKELAVVIPDPPNEEVMGQLRLAYPCERIWICTPDDLGGHLLGLYNKAMEFSSLGVLKDIDFFKKEILVLTAMQPQEIKGIEYSDYRIDFEI